MITVTRLTSQDINDVTAAALEFWAESDQDGQLTVVPDKYRAMLSEYLHNNFVRSFIARDEHGNLAGYIHIYCQDDYTEELIGELYQFYVRKDYRGTQAARLLVNAANEQYKEWGCARAYSEVGHGGQARMMSDKLFVNLWSKFGYNVKGTVLMKEYK